MIPQYVFSEKQNIAAITCVRMLSISEMTANTFVSTTIQSNCQVNPRTKWL